MKYIIKPSAGSGWLSRKLKPATAQCGVTSARKPAENQPAVEENSA
jgi:hypothetical protein